MSAFDSWPEMVDAFNEYCGETAICTCENPHPYVDGVAPAKKMDNSIFLPTIWRCRKCGGEIYGYCRICGKKLPDYYFGNERICDECMIDDIMEE